MSLANSLRLIDGQLLFARDQSFLTTEPSKPNDAARISDTIAYFGNATYPLDASQVILPTDVSFTSLFQSGFSTNDYLRVRPVTDLFNFQQLANVEYSVYLDSISMPKFKTRLVATDISLNVVKEYFAITYDPSNVTIDPPVIDGFTIKGWSLVYPRNTEYLFLQIENSEGTGGAEVRFSYANSQLENAIDNSKEESVVGSRPSQDLITIDYFQTIRDISGVEKDLTIIEGEVAVLQSQVATLQDDVSQNTADIVDLSSGKLNASGGVLLSNLNADSNKIINLATPTDAGDAVNKAYADDIVVNVDASLNALTSQVSANTIGINSLAQATASLNNNKVSKAGDTMTGILSMSNNKITNVATATQGQDATNKAYVDNAIANIPTGSVLKYREINFSGFSPPLQATFSTNINLMPLPVGYYSITYSVQVFQLTGQDNKTLSILTQSTSTGGGATSSLLCQKIIPYTSLQSVSGPNISASDIFILNAIIERTSDMATYQTNLAIAMADNTSSVTFNFDCPFTFYIQPIQPY